MNKEAIKTLDSASEEYQPQKFSVSLTPFKKLTELKNALKEAGIDARENPGVLSIYTKSIKEKEAMDIICGQYNAIPQLGDESRMSEMKFGRPGGKYGLPNDNLTWPPKED